MVTSVHPDPNRDYDVKNDIPELLSAFKESSENLREQAVALEKKDNNGGSDASLLYRLSEQLESLYNQPNTIPARLNKFKENLSGLSALILDLKLQPLMLDFFYIASYDAEKPEVKSNFFEKMTNEFLMFINTFFDNYKASSDKSLEVWVGSAKDQYNIINRLADDNFVQASGIDVNIKLVPGSLLQATMAGKGPDVALNCSRSEPVNLALRGSIASLNEKEGFDEVVEQFMPSAIIPYEILDKCFALPETQIFDMMFCRMDILAELGIRPPETWEDLYYITPIIQRSNMEIGLPYVGGMQNIFSTLLLQNGGSFFNESRTKLIINDKIGYNAFLQWIDFYQNLGLSLYKDDYNRFRTGEMPLTIMPYTFYNKLSAAAPEIRGLWQMFPIPGTRAENGVINRKEAGDGSAAMILSKADDKEGAWEFLKWWVSTETQYEFGNEIEALLGTAARYPTANTSAFQQLKWSNKEIEMLNEQWNNVTEIPEVAGSYYVPRNIDNAFRSVLFRNQEPREMINHWTQESNKEITRKLKEFDLPID